MIKLSDYEQVVGKNVIEELKSLGQRLSGKVVRNINSTSVGGGVAGGAATGFESGGPTDFVDDADRQKEYSRGCAVSSRSKQTYPMTSNWTSRTLLSQGYRVSLSRGGKRWRNIRDAE